jgi:outer membrane protein assembly factor BamE (lipoprotein component of BamABCDE complex)
MQHLRAPALLLAFLASTVASCTSTLATHGQVILPSRLAQITPGTTTRGDVQRLLGSPSAQGTFNDSRWYYITSTVKDKPLNPNLLQKREVVIIDFDPSGTVVGMTTKDESEGKDITPDKAMTATHGQSLGIIDSMINDLGGGLKSLGGGGGGNAQ